MFGSELDQVYQGAEYDDYKSALMVSQTQDEVLLYKKDVLKVYYHASSGGFSELPQNVWPNKSARDNFAYEAKASPFDVGLKGSSWSIRMSPHFGVSVEGIGKLIDVKVLDRSEGKRVKRI